MADDELRELPPFPLDDLTLDALDHALNTCIGERSPDADPDEPPPYVASDPSKPGGEYGLWELMDFLSGYDPAKVQDHRPGRPDSARDRRSTGRGIRRRAGLPLHRRDAGDGR